jgi:phosphatidylethanolamine-binding protein (PEBP) family uncharacterized protein
VTDLKRPPLPHDFHPQVPSFTVVSEDFEPGAVLKDAQVYAAGNTSPQLRWEGFPAETKSFAGKFEGLPAGAVQVRNDYGTKDFGGAAPPPGDPAHRYVFTVYAVDQEKLGPDSDASPAVVGFNLRFHTLARAQVIAEYAASADS